MARTHFQLLLKPQTLAGTNLKKTNRYLSTTFFLKLLLGASQREHS